MTKSGDSKPAVEKDRALSWDDRLLQWAEKWNPFFDVMVKISQLLAIIGGVIAWFVSNGGILIVVGILLVINPGLGISLLALVAFAHLIARRRSGRN